MKNPDPPRSAVLANGFTAEVILDGDEYVGVWGYAGHVGRWGLDGSVATDDTPSPIVSLDGVPTQIVVDGWCAAPLPCSPTRPSEDSVLDGLPVGSVDHMFGPLPPKAAPILAPEEAEKIRNTLLPKETGTSRRREILERIASCVCRDRQNTYGDAEDNFKDIADYWNLWLRQRGLLAPDKEIDPLDVAQMSAFIKVARKVGNLDYLDNWVDGGGYEVCGAGIVLSREGGKP